MNKKTFLTIAILNGFLLGCNDSDSIPSVVIPSVVIPPYNKDLVFDHLASLPDDMTPIEFSHETSISYNTETSKGNDAASTKKADLIKWYDTIRHANEDDIYRNFDGSTHVFAEPPQWEGGHKIGVLSKEYAENALDYYNFLRALYGGSRSYMSGYKQIAAQASSWSILGGGHYPSQDDANELGISQEVFNWVHHGRGGSNLMGSTVNTTADYENMKDMPRNAELTSIWNEGEWGSIAGLGHRAVFLDSTQKDIGIGIVNGLNSWLVWGSYPKQNDGSGLGGDDQQTIYDASPEAAALTGVKMWPSHGYFPLFALKGHNQSTSLAYYTEYVKSIVKADTEKGELEETITLKMEYFKHAEDGDLANDLTTPYKILILTDLVSTREGYSGQNQGGTGPHTVDGKLGADWVDPCKGDDQSICEENNRQDAGGYHFTTSHGYMAMVFRMPYGWYKEMSEDINQTDSPPQYHTIRYSFSSKKSDGTAGDSLKIIKPFYMNPEEGKYLVAQTTFFDILRHRGTPTQ